MFYQINSLTHSHPYIASFSSKTVWFTRSKTLRRFNSYIYSIHMCFINRRRPLMQYHVGQCCLAQCLARKLNWPFWACCETWDRYTGCHVHVSTISSWKHTRLIVSTISSWKHTRLISVDICSFSICPYLCIGVIFSSFHKVRFFPLRMLLLMSVVTDSVVAGAAAFSSLASTDFVGSCGFDAPPGAVDFWCSLGWHVGRRTFLQSLWYWLLWLQWRLQQGQTRGGKSKRWREIDTYVGWLRNNADKSRGSEKCCHLTEPSWSRLACPWMACNLLNFTSLILNLRGNTTFGVPKSSVNPRGADLSCC